MIQKKLLVLALFALTLFSCSKDDGPSTLQNSTPVITNATKAFTVAENINDTFVIGTVTATDADKDDTLTFSISANSDNLFEITNAGVISLAAGKTLSFATKSSHALEIIVSDGTASSKATFTITVTQVDVNNETPVIEAQSFEVAENINDTFIIGTVTATDAEEDSLTFAIVEDVSELFEITPAGKLSLVDGASLDFDTTEEHTLTVGVSDSNTTAQAIITVNVTKVDANNQTPVIEAQSFEAAENIADTYVIGAVIANDPEDDTLTFSIFEDTSGLFEITENGQLSLLQGSSLDLDLADEHILTVSVSDGNTEAQATITIIVVESATFDPAAFVTKWIATTDMEEIVIGVDLQTGSYDFQIDWGDGTMEDLNDGNIANGEIAHTYETAGTYTVTITGTFPTITMDGDSATPLKLASIEQWGTIQWQSMYQAFIGCSNMVYNATDAPDLSQVTTMARMFYGASSFNGDLNNWNVSNVTNMSGMFYGANSFNGDVSEWNVGSVTDMSSMFGIASSFNGDLSEWNVGSVTSMNGMFTAATSFNGDISDWTTDSATSMSQMFFNAQSFNADISGWNVSNVTRFTNMFLGASLFNQNLGNWEIANATKLDGMLNSTGLSTANYDATLIGWAGQNDTPDNLTLGANGLTYCSAADARDALINKGWTITDAGEDCN